VSQLDKLCLLYSSLALTHT